MTLDPAVNNNEYINIEWSGYQSISEDRYTVSDIMRGSGSNYTATLIISPLAVQDDDVMITCTGIVSGGTSATANDDVTINVMGEFVYVLLLISVSLQLYQLPLLLYLLLVMC